MVLWSGSPVDHGHRLFGEGEVSSIRAELDVRDGTVGPESVQDGLGNQGDEVDLTVRVHCQKQRTAARVKYHRIVSETKTSKPGFTNYLPRVLVKK